MGLSVTRACRCLGAMLLVACVSLQASAADDYAPPEKGKAIDAIKESVAAAAKSGKKMEAWIKVFGASSKVEVVKSDAKILTIKVQGNNFDQQWDKLTPEDIASLGKAAVQEDANRALALADYCMASDMMTKADDALTLAAKIDPKIGKPFADRLKFFNGMKPAAVAPAAGGGNAVVAAMSGVSGAPSVSASAKEEEAKPYAAPAKMEFKGSDTSGLAPVKTVAAAIDNAIEINLADMGVKPEPLCDDAAFLRRATLDLTGQIPAPEDVIAFFNTRGSDKREKKIEQILAEQEYADHWANFWTTLLVGRHGGDRENVKISLLRQWMREQFAKNEKYDKIVKDILTASGDADKSGPANYLAYHLDDNLPNTVAHVSQTFLGARIGCAQCHDHPFDKWSQQDFWGFAAFLANTKSDGHQKREDPANPERITYQWRELTDQNQRNGGGRYDPPQRELIMPPKALDGPVFAVAKKPAQSNLKGGKDGKGMGMDSMAMKDKDAMKDKSKDKMAMDKMAMDKKDGKDNKMSMDNKMGMDGMGMGSGSSGSGEVGMQYREALADWITSKDNEKFAQSAVNRVWRSMFGYGLVEPIDDIRPKNPPSHPDAMAILVADFNASGRDMKRMIQIIANTKAYQRSANGASGPLARQRAVRYAARAEVRPITPESLLVAIIKATGGPEKAKAMMEGLRARDKAVISMLGTGIGKDMMGTVGQDVNQFYGLMQRFVNSSTAEDRAGKLQFEGTVTQALMMMHSGFMNNAIKQGVDRFKKKGMGDMVYIFAATLGRPPAGPESAAFSSFSGGLEGAMWVLLNSAEFVTVH